MAALLAAPPASAAGTEKAESGMTREGNTVTLPYALGTFDLGVDIHGMLFVSIRVEQDDCDADEECDVKLTLRLENRMSEDGEATVIASILGGDGGSLVSEKERKSVEEDENEKMTIKLEVPAKATASVEKLRLELDAEED